MWDELRWDYLSHNQSGKLVTSHFGKRIQVAHLLLNTFTGTVKPEALTGSPVDTQGSTDCTAIPTGLQQVLLGEELDSFVPASFDRDAQVQGKIASVDTNVPGWEWLRHEYPEMPSTTTHFES